MQNKQDRTTVGAVDTQTTAECPGPTRESADPGTEFGRQSSSRQEIERALESRLSKHEASLELTTQRLLDALEREREAGHRLLREIAGGDEVALASRAGMELLVAGVARLQQSLERSHLRMGALEAQLSELRRERDELERNFRNARREREALQAELDLINGSFSMRLGRLLVGALRSPSTLVRLPGQLLALAWRALPRLRDAARRRLGRAVPHARVDFGGAVNVTDVSLPRDDEMPEAPERIQPGPRLASLLPDAPGDMRVAAVMDEFTQHAYEDSCVLLPLTLAYWRKEIEEFKPDVLFVESAWRGRHGSWARKVYPLSTDLVELVAWCRSRDIPTVFWNKEDPVHLSVFMKTARQFDFVFTTDIDCLRTYRRKLGHNNVYWLPFACQPADHNPVEHFERKDAFCFAGSYYAKYGERRRDFAELIGAISNVRDVEIFDRNHGTGDPGLQFPEEYRRFIKGNLAYGEISKAYKGYRFGVNLNTVKQSQSMFARRAFELLASNTVTVSNFSRGLRLMLGDLVIASDSGRQVARRAGELADDESAYRRFRLAGLRKVMGEHTYADRVRYIFEKLRGMPLASSADEVVVVGRVSSEAEARSISRSFMAQAMPHKRLVLVVAGGLRPDELSLGPDIEVLDDARARETRVESLCAGRWLAVFSAHDHYGSNYLTDLALARRYSDAPVIGKGAWHAWTDGGPRIERGLRTYVTGRELAAHRSILSPQATSGTSLDEWLEAGARERPLVGLSIDEFNYCEGGAGRDCADVDDLVGLNPGASLEHLYTLAEAVIEEDVEEEGSVEGMPGIDAAALASLLKVGNHAEGRVRLAEDDGILHLGSSLEQDAHAYIYASRPMALEEVFPDASGRLNLVADTDMLLSLVLIFSDGRGKRVGHAIRACSSNLNITPPPAAKQVRIGVRVQGGGHARIHKLVLGHVPSEAIGIPATGEHLVVTRGYPSYQNLYSYTYVHRRVAGYREKGLDVDVFRLTDAPYAFDEFEGVDVVSGRLTALEMMLASNRYKSILVHSLDRSLWSVLEPLAGQVPIHVWIHGAEIQPWYRRDFSFENVRERERGMQRSADRMAFWHRFVRNLPDNVSLVFVSEQLARTAMRDLGVTLARDRYRVIHNHVDGTLFERRSKEPEQRLKILSIRPYHRRTYPNELTIRAIQDLSREPWFPELEFRIVGDGALFDTTVEPIRGFPNVVVEKRFLSQDEIASLHRDYGVFICPTRIDSQGVSRDEAMASGLVPVTNRVSAVPEFVDDSCAMLVAPEDWRGLADSIRRLYADPDLFVRMSERAAARVRSQSGELQTLAREVSLIRGEGESCGLPPERDEPMRIALYGDLDLNIIDGSAVWAASLARMLSRQPGVEVDLFLKAPLHSTTVLAELIRDEKVRLVEPVGTTARLTPVQAVEAVLDADAERGYAACILRGFELAGVAAATPQLAGRRVVYMTDVPTRVDDIDALQCERLHQVLESASIVLCQTPQIRSHLESFDARIRGRTMLLPPMLPPAIPTGGPSRTDAGATRLAYAGKFAPAWGILEMFSAFEALRERGLDIELHVYGDKIHNPESDPGFAPRVKQALEHGEGVHWHRGMDRSSVLQALAGMDLGWAWRSPELEGSTLELSTKVLEYAAVGLPVLLARGAVNEDLLGPDYPLFVAPGESPELVLEEFVRTRASRDQALGILESVAGRFQSARVGEEFVAPLVDAIEGLRATGEGSA